MSSAADLRKNTNWAATAISGMMSLHPAIIVATIIALIPLANGLILRTYSFPLKPSILNPIFELEWLYLAVEVGIVFWAREKGMSFRTEFGQLSKITRYALIAYLATYWVSSLVYSPTYLYSLIRVSYWAVHIATAFSLGYLLCGVTAGAIRSIAVLFAASVIALSSLVVIHYLSISEPPSMPGEGFPWSAYAPGFLSIRQFGMVVGFSASFWLGYLLHARAGELKLWILLPFSTLIFAALVWSGTRSALLGIAIAMFLSSILAKKLPSLQISASILLAAGLGAILSQIWLPPDAAFGMFNSERFAIGDGTDVTSGRTPIWMFGLSMFGKSPLFGWGEGSFYPLYAMAGRGYHLQPHNFIIQFLMSWGIIAGGIALFMMFRTLARLHWRVRDVALMTVPLAALDCILAMAMLDGALFTLRTILPAIFFWILAEKIYIAKPASESRNVSDRAN
jgi:exopolysaccharide production protein ExoQ